MGAKGALAVEAAAKAPSKLLGSRVRTSKRVDAAPCEMVARTGGTAPAEPPAAPRRQRAHGETKASQRGEGVGAFAPRAAAERMASSESARLT